MALATAIVSQKNLLGFYLSGSGSGGSFSASFSHACHEEGRRSGDEKEQLELSREKEKKSLEDISELCL